jgi:ankyrin repeat protein
MTLHEFLDVNYGADGDTVLRQRLADGADPNARDAKTGETPLHVANRRRRKSAVTIQLDHGAAIYARTRHGKTAYAHAIRRGFGELVTLLGERGADTTLNEADRFAVAVVEGRLNEARTLLAKHPQVIRTGNPEEDRLLADMAGRNDSERVKFLLSAGADLSTPGLDDGTPLHQAAWFGQPANARLLIAAGAPLDSFEPVHGRVHGARYSGGSEQAQEAYVELVRMLLAAGCSLCYPDRPDSDAYLTRLLNDATPAIREVLHKRNNILIDDFH